MPTRPSNTTAASGWALRALALGAFAVGTAELILIGVLNVIARHEGVSVSTAGHLVTAYALGIAVGAPLITALTARVGRRALLRFSLAAFVAGNAVALASTSFHMLLIARVFTGSIHGLFIGVASVIAAGLVAPERRGKAIATVFGGIAVATVVGVPLGTLIGQAMGWRAAFALVVVLACVALIASLLFVPSVSASRQGPARSQVAAAFAPRVLAVLSVGLVLMGAQFTAFTYLAPFLSRVTGVSGALVSVFLLVFGLAAAAGTVIGGRAADHSANNTLVIANASLVVVLGGLFLVRAMPALVLVLLAAWGLSTFALVPALQLRVITLAGPGRDLAATLGASAVNAGIAIGSVLGGAVLAAHGAAAPVLVALILSAITVPASWALRFLEIPSAAQDANAEDNCDGASPETTRGAPSAAFELRGAAV